MKENKEMMDYLCTLYNLPAEIVTLDYLLRLCPHLDRFQAESFFELAKLIPDGVIIPFPPLKVREVRQMTRLIYNGSGAYTLRRVGVERAELIAQGGHTIRAIASEKALNFSLKYQEELISIKDFDDYAEIWLEDPLGIKKERVVYFVVREKWQAIISNDTKPTSQVLEGNIVIAVADPFTGDELRLGSIDHPRRLNCIWCGGGISTKGCESNHCESGETLPEEYKPYLWRTPLPPKLVEVLKKNGHEFEIPPQIARNEEKLQWELP